MKRRAAEGAAVVQLARGQADVKPAQEKVEFAWRTVLVEERNHAARAERIDRVRHFGRFRPWPWYESSVVHAITRPMVARH